MIWIEGIERQQNRYWLKTINETGQYSMTEPANMKKIASLGIKQKRVKLTTRCSDWNPATAKEYLDGVGFPQQVGERHQIYSFSDISTRYLIPASVLLTALVRPFEKLSALLFNPQGLEHICVPDIIAPTPRVSITLSGLSIRDKNRLTIQQPLYWMSCFLSARNMWNSVYLNAAQQRLGLQLPVATIQLVVKGIKRGETFFVTEACVTQVTTEENPIAFAKPGTQTFLFHEAASYEGTPENSTRSDEIPSRSGGVMALSDTEWEKVSKIILNNKARQLHRQKHDLRELVDTMLMKWSLNISWKKMTYKSGSWNNAQNFYVNWKKDGRWVQILMILAESRKRHEF